MTKKVKSKIYAFPNPDKEWHESWKDAKSLADFPHPSRFILCGKPNTGKTNCCLNILLHQHPPFERIVVVHHDLETKEYSHVDAELIDYIPDKDFFDPDQKTVCIIDDLDTKALGKEQKSNLDRLHAYVATHRNVSVIQTCQDAFQVSPNIRRMANVLILWKPSDFDSMANLSRKAGLKKEDLREIFNKLMPNNKDSLTIDMTDGTPHKFRKNLFYPIEREEENTVKENG